MIDYSTGKLVYVGEIKIHLSDIVLCTVYLIIY